MFEPEIRDASTIKRWGIVRTHRDQNNAEHSFYVTLYAMELAQWAHPDKHDFHAAVARAALWHDLKDEIFTGDIPGPAKRRAIANRDYYDSVVSNWTRLIFGSDERRFGQHEWHEELKCVIKVADELDQVFEMACEIRLGNMNVRKVMKDALNRAVKWIDEWFDQDPRGDELKVIVTQAAAAHVENDPRGPTIFTLRSS